MKILLIDDNVEIDKMLQKYLQTKGEECIATTDGRNGLALMRQQRFDIVLLDLAMPDFTGFDVVNELSKSDEIKHQKIIVLTAASISQDQVDRLLKAGVKSVLRKPVSPDVLMGSIKGEI